MIIGIGALTVVALVLGSAYYAYRIAFYVPPEHQENIFELPRGADVAEKRETMVESIHQLSALPYEAVTITSDDGTELFGRYYHTQDGAPVQLQFHGYRGSAMRDFCGGTTLARNWGIMRWWWISAAMGIVRAIPSPSVCWSDTIAAAGRGMLTAVLGRIPLCFYPVFPWARQRC